MIIHGKSGYGLVDGYLTIFKLGSKCGNYHGKLNAAVKDKSLNKLASNSVVVMDDACYHCEQVEKIPTMSSLKRAVQDWLREYNVVFTRQY